MKLSSDQFLVYIKSFIDINGGKRPTKEQWKVITEVLNDIFTKKTNIKGDLNNNLGNILNNNFGNIISDYILPSPTYAGMISYSC